MLENNKRSKGRYTADYFIKDCYKFYRQSDYKNKILKDDYFLIYKTFINKIMYLILKESMEFKIPFRLGTLSIRKKKIVKIIDEDGNVKSYNRPVDYKKTIEMWEKLYGTKDKKELSKIKNKKAIFHDNKHSNGYTFKLYWDKLLCNVPNQYFYAFKGARNWLRSIKLLNKLENIEYYEIK